MIISPSYDGLILYCKGDTLVQKQRGFPLDTSGISAKLSTGTQYSVAWDYNGNGIVTDSTADSLCGHSSAVFTLKLPGNLTVA